MTDYSNATQACVFGKIYAQHLRPDLPDLNAAWSCRGGAAGVMAAMGELSPCDVGDLADKYRTAFLAEARRILKIPVEDCSEIELSCVGAGDGLTIALFDDDDEELIDDDFYTANACSERAFEKMLEQI